MLTKSIIIILLFLSNLGLVKECLAQNDKIYDHYTDTLIVLDELVLDTYKVLIKREQILTVDTLNVNLKGFTVSSFNFSALSLGANISIDSKDGLFTEAMKAEVRNEKVQYKFIYIKDIVLLTDDGTKVIPSLGNIKITFSN